MAKGHRTRPWRTVFEIDDGGPFAPAASMAAISSGVKGAILAEWNKGRWCILGSAEVEVGRTRKGTHEGPQRPDTQRVFASSS